MPTKFPPNWQYRSLEVLENDFWPKTDYPTGLVERVHKLRKIPLNELQTGDLGVLIRQEVGLPYILPLALEQLKEDLFVEGDYYPGDLLKNVLEIREGFWLEHKDLMQEVYALIADREADLEELGIKSAGYLDMYERTK